jgi:hypothetical protein
MSALRADKFRVIGGLHAVWCVFDTHSEDGRLDGYSLGAMDAVIGWPGFSEQMAAIGWLVVDGETLVAPRFDEHNGQSAKRRATDAKRKAESREQAPGYGGSRKGVRDLSASDADKKETREEKRREESSSLRSEDKAAPLTIADLMADGLDEETAAEWMKLRAKHKAPLTPRAWAAIKAEAEKAEWSVLDAVTKCLARGWRGFDAEWLTKEQKPAAAPGKHTGFDKTDYREGIGPNGELL